MPGFAPFAPSLELPPYVCRNCGFWQRYFEVPPQCPLCLDARHVVPPKGWAFFDAETARDRFPMHVEETFPGVFRFWNEPVDGIGSHSYLITTKRGNLLFEGATVYSAAALRFISEQGGVSVLAASHPHTYGALWQIQDSFDPQLVLHPADFKWSSALQITRPFDDSIEVLDGLTLIHSGVHFAGHTFAYDGHREILFCGDALKFDLHPTRPNEAVAVSTHKAFVRGVPLTKGETQTYLDRFSKLNFTTTCTPFEQVTNFGRREAVQLCTRFIEDHPSPDPQPLNSL